MSGCVFNSLFPFETFNDSDQDHQNSENDSKLYSLNEFFSEEKVNKSHQEHNFTNPFIAHMATEYLQNKTINLIFGSSMQNTSFTRSLIKSLGYRCREISFNRRNFPDGEFCCAIERSIRNRRVYIVQSGIDSSPQHLSPADLVFETQMIADAARRADASEIVLVSPYMSFACQDRKDQPRAPLSFKVAVNGYITNGIDKFIVADIHSAQLENAFPCRNSIGHLRATEVFGDFLRSTKWFNPEECVLVSPDVGGLARVKSLAKSLGGLSIAHGDKEHRYDGAKIEVMVGDVTGKKAIVVDDMIRSGGSIFSIVKLLRLHGVNQVTVLATHGILCSTTAGESAQSVLARADIDYLITTNTIEHDQIIEQGIGEHRILDIAPRFARAIINYHDGGSLSQINVDQNWVV